MDGLYLWMLVLKDKICRQIAAKLFSKQKKMVFKNSKKHKRTDSICERLQ